MVPSARSSTSHTPGAPGRSGCGGAGDRGGSAATTSASCQVAESTGTRHSVFFSNSWRTATAVPDPLTVTESDRCCWTMLALARSRGLVEASHSDSSSWNCSCCRWIQMGIGRSMVCFGGSRGGGGGGGGDGDATGGRRRSPSRRRSDPAAARVSVSGRSTTGMRWPSSITSVQASSGTEPGGSGAGAAGAAAASGTGRAWHSRYRPARNQSAATSDVSSDASCPGDTCGSCRHETRPSDDTSTTVRAPWGGSVRIISIRSSADDGRRSVDTILAPRLVGLLGGDRRRTVPPPWPGP